jgi:hypothetical protein
VHGRQSAGDGSPQTDAFLFVDDIGLQLAEWLQGPFNIARRHADAAVFDR